MTQFIPVLLGIHLLICAFLIGAILLQRSEGGGALGMGGGPSGMMSGRSAANFMTRATTGLGVAFFATSMLLTILSGQQTSGPSSIMDDGSTKDGISTKAIDLSVPAAPATPANAVIPPAEGGIPASAPAVAPAPAEAQGEAAGEAPAPASAPADKK
jgi:preprotein translocase subunit SecG